MRLANFTAIPGGLPFEVFISPAPHATMCNDACLRDLLARLLDDHRPPVDCRDRAAEAAAKALVEADLQAEKASGMAC